jgi:transglutaminase-like putative cysteine protease
MSVRVAITHRTEYLYDRAVVLSPHVFRLRPAVHCRTPITAYSLTITPEKHFIHWQQDPFGNYQARVVFPDQTRKLTVAVDLVAEMTVINPFDFFLDDSAETIPFYYGERLHKELLPYLEIDEDGPLLRMGRFHPHAHPPGPMSPPSEDPATEYPYTLDLRLKPDPMI